MHKRKSGIILVLIALLATMFTIMGCAKFSILGCKNEILNCNGIMGWGASLNGGYYAVLTPNLEGCNEDELDSLLKGTVDILRTRLDRKGYTEATITIQGVGYGQEIRVDISEIDDPNDLLKVIRLSGELTFESSTGTIYLTGADIKESQAGYDKDGNPLVYLEFTTQGTSKFAEATKALAGDVLYIKLGDYVVSQPQIKEQIVSSTAEITGIATYEEAELIAAVINAGKLPLDLVVRETNLYSKI